jgi:bis(5'-nucleosyl)-tetraphosphatase (symmetrical)
MAVYAVGDLQGCLDPLRRLLDRVGYDPSADRLWFTGDLVNRGPASLASLRFVHSLGASATVVLGNHDLHLLATAFTGNRPRKRRDTLQEILDAPDRGELLEWLRHRPLLHHDAELGFAMVHAGLPPHWDLAEAQAAAAELEAVLRGPGCQDFLRQMYGNSPALWNPALEGVDRLRYIVNAFTRMRFVRADGGLEFVHKGPAESAGPGLLPWFRVPGRRNAGLRVVFGHWSLLGAIECNDAYSLDTGCVYGGRLTALRLDDLARTSVACSPELPAPRAD